LAARGARAAAAREAGDRVSERRLTHPVALGLVTSFNRPGGNVTGISFMTAEMGTKLLGLLHELLPQAARFVALVNPTSLLAEPFIKDLQAGARTLGLQAEVLYAGTDREIDAAFATLVQKRADVLLIAPDALFTSRRAQLATLSLRHAVPSTHVIREFAEAGGLISYGPNLADAYQQTGIYTGRIRYGPNLADAYQQTGIYTGRILKGERPADLPVAQRIKFELVINLKTAKMLGLNVPDKLLALADEVIE
jgi:ABC-type uncharacterized transport system substrate-binding protein